MSLPLFFPAPSYVTSATAQADVGTTMSLRELCARAGVACQASGAWTERCVTLTDTEGPGFVRAKPGSSAAVCIGVPPAYQGDDRHRYALGVMAYSLMDLVARQSIAGAPWAKVERRGRPALPAGQRLSNKERQRRHRARKLGATSAQRIA